MKLDLDAGMVKLVARQLGLDPKTILRDQVQEQVRVRMAAHVPAIAAAMERAGMTLARKSEAEVVRDALFRLWRAVITVRGGGHLADLIRDSHDDRIVAELAERVRVETSLADVVGMAMEATVELAF